MHFRVGETDGVSLEMEKWKSVLEKMGHTIIYIAGSGGSISDFVKIKGLHYKHPDNQFLVDALYKKEINNISEIELKKKLSDYTEEIREELSEAIKKNKLDIIIPNNILSLGWNIGAGLATIQAIKETGIGVVCHHHDFYWERELYSNPRYDWVKTLLQENFPPKMDGVKHVVINRIAQEEMTKRGFKSQVIPNVFDFEKENWKYDDYLKNIRNDLNINNEQIVFLQGTRVVERKGIELIIEYIATFNKKIKAMRDTSLYDGRKVTFQTEGILLLVGQNEDQDYYDSLIKFAEKRKVRILDVSQRFAHSRMLDQGRKVYSFWDAYKLGDIVSYPSLLEGFGNQFLEAIYGRKPVVLYEYPVYKQDLKQYGFQVISLGDKHVMKDRLATIENHIIEDGVERGIELLTHKEEYNAVVKENYDICLRYFSYAALEEALQKILI